MGIIFSPSELPPIPPSAEGIDVNFCKNPRCANFGVAPNFAKFERRQKAVEAGEPGKAYRLIGVGKHRPGLTCTLCGEHFSVKSNLAVAQERNRLLRYLTPTSKSCCTSACAASTASPSQQLRRSVNMLERPIQTASKARRTWYGYSPYSPLMVEKLLAIYRTMHNYVEVGRDGRTPALRLGLTAANYKPEDVLYFSS